ncbi:hypothetical protein NKDENANG_03398 [Candidatus Entotheonellaceae bacterium PAL068K]
MVFRDIIGQQLALDLLQKTLAGSRLTQAYLFYGPSGVGKRLTALQFTKALYCLSARNDACDACPICRKIDADNHPDIIRVRPDKTTLTIEQIRSLQHRLSRKPYEEQRITVILDGCEHLTPPAANALLKTLEEPPSNALLILLTSNREVLPLTLVSRCQLVPFRPLAASHIGTILTRQGIASDTARLAASLAEGRLDQCLPETFDRMLATRQQAYTVLQEVTQPHRIDAFLQARQLAGSRQQCEELLRWLSLFCRDLTILKIAPQTGLYHRDLRSELLPLAQRLPLAGLLDAFSLIQHRRTSLSLYGNPQLIFEQVMIELQQLFLTSAEAPRRSETHRATLEKSLTGQIP